MAQIPQPAPTPQEIFDDVASYSEDEYTRPGGGTEYVVKKGDNLWRIAERELGQPHRWQEIAELNNLSNPDLIHPGQVLQLPTKPSPNLRGGEGPLPTEGPPSPDPEEGQFSEEQSSGIQDWLLGPFAPNRPDGPSRTQRWLLGPAAGPVNRLMQGPQEDPSISGPLPPTGAPPITGPNELIQQLIENEGQGRQDESLWEKLKQLLTQSPDVIRSGMGLPPVRRYPGGGSVGGSVEGEIVDINRGK
jgi:LysM repeat protein